MADASQDAKDDAPPPGPGSAPTSDDHAVVSLVLGVGCVVAGGLALAFPTGTVAVLGIVLGVQLLLAGVVRVWAVNAFVLPQRTRYIGCGLGFLSIGAGAACLVRPAMSVLLLAILVGVGWLTNGFAEVVSSATGTAMDRGFALMTGVLSALAGLVLLLAPRPTVAALAQTAGACLLVLGVAYSVSGVRDLRSS